MFRVLLGVSVLLALLSGIWLLNGSDTKESPPAANHPPIHWTETPARVRPALPVLPTPANPVTPTNQLSLKHTYATEIVVDDFVQQHQSLVATTVAELQEKGIGAPVKIDEITCRATLCLLRLSGASSTPLVALVDALQDERGFWGKARGIQLSGTATAMELYIRF